MCGCCGKAQQMFRANSWLRRGSQLVWCCIRPTPSATGMRSAPHAPQPTPMAFVRSCCLLPNCPPPVGQPRGHSVRSPNGKRAAGCPEFERYCSASGGARRVDEEAGVERSAVWFGSQGGGSGWRGRRQRRPGRDFQVCLGVRLAWSMRFLVTLHNK